MLVREPPAVGWRQEEDPMNLQKRYLLMGGAVLAILLTLAAGLLFWGRTSPIRSMPDRPSCSR